VTVGILLILGGLLVMLLGMLRLGKLQGPQDESPPDADWYDDSIDTASGSDSNFPHLSFLATVIGALLGGAILVVFGIVECFLS